MGLFDDIPTNGSAPAPKGGLFDDVPVETGFNARFEGEKAALRPQLEQGLVRQAEGMGRPSQGKAALLGAGRGATAEFLDEAASGVNAAVDVATGQAPQGFGAAYDARLGSARQQIRDAEMVHPVTTLASGVAGAIPAAALAPGLSGAMAYGALSGFGSGEGVSDRLFQGAIGTGVGAAAHGAVTGVTRAGAAIARFGGNLVRSVTNAPAAGARKVATALERDAASAAPGLDDAAVQAATAAGQPVANIDRGSTATRRLARMAADASPEAEDALNGRINPRFEDQGGRVAGFVQRLAVGPRGQLNDVALTTEQLQQASRQATEPLYRRAYTAGDRDLWDPVLEQIANTSLGQEALRRAVRRSADRDMVNGLAPMNPRVTLDDADRIVFGRGGMPSYPNLQLWDYAKRELDDMAQGAGRDSLAGPLANRLRTHLDGLVPEYRNARTVASRFFGGREALEAGASFIDDAIDNATARRNFGRLPQVEQRLFREGFARDLVNRVMAVPDRRSILNAMFLNNPTARERIEIAMGRQAANELEAFLRVENVMDLARPAVQGNSHTARLLRDLTFTGVGGLAGNGGVSDVNPNGLSGGAVVGLLFSRGVGAANARVARHVGELLASNDPARIHEATRLIARSPRLMHGMRRVEDMVVRSIGPAANENIVQPAANAAFAGARRAAASDTEVKKDEQR